MTKRLALPIILLALLLGCQTPTANDWKTVAGKSLMTAAQTVDAAMKGWWAYEAAGHATPADDARARALYADYQLSMMLAEAAYKAAVAANDPNLFTAASARLSQSVANVTSTIGGK